MANDKKFIVKNGLLTPQNAVIGSNTDTGEKLQVTGTTKLSGEVEITQSTAASPSLDVINSGGYLQNSVIATFRGDSDSLQIINSGQGDYKLGNSGQDNSITFYDNTAGIRISYNGSPRLDIKSTGNDFTGLATTTIEGNRILTTADEGPGNGLDADTVDGLEASQFLRSDVDDTAAGNIIIQQDLTVNQNVQVDGDLTVSGNTTYVDTETILLSDNIITLNANHSGAPTQDAGWEVNRGSSANSGVLWDETNDWFRLNSAGTNLGRIITTADEGPGNGFDADTVDGLHGEQFLRSDVDDTANGNITILGSLILGDNVGGAELVFDGAGQDRRIYSENGEIGFLDATFNYAAKSDTNSNWIVDNDVRAGQDVDADRNVIASVDLRADTGNITALQGNIVASQGNIAALQGDVQGQRFIDVDNASYFLNPADFSQLHSIGLDDDLYHNGDTDTKLSFATNEISLQTGGAERLGIADTEITATVDFYAPDVYVNDDIVHNGDTDTKVNFTTDTIKLNTGGATRLTANNSGVFVDDLTASGDISAGGDVSGGTGTFTGDVTAPRFVDADNNNYFADPAGDSQFNTVDIDDYVRHRGDTDTYLGFDTNDNIVFNTAGTERLEINGTNITATVDGIFPNLFASRYYDSQNATYYGDFASTSRINDISLVGEIIHDGDTNTLIHFNAADSVEVQTGGAQRLLINNTYVLATNQMRSPIYYDSNDTNFYLDPNSTSQLNRIDINDYIRHRGDTNTFMGFDANDSITFQTGGAERLNITDANSTFTHNVIVQGDVQANRFVDRNNTNYYVNPADGTLSATLAAGIRIENIANYSRWADNSGNGGIALMGYGDANGSTSNPSMAISGNVAGGYALQYLNLIDSSSNPTGNGQRYIHFYHDGVAGGSIKGDSSGNIYQVLHTNTNWGFWTSSYGEALIVDDSANVMVNNSTAPTYTTMDNTPLVGSITNNKLHVGGSIQLASNDDAIVFGRGTASFLKDEELGFGWGGGWYMTDGTYLRVRNNKTIYSTGDAHLNRYYAYQNTAYYLDPDGDSQLNTVDIDDYVRHRGDTNTYVGFPAADQIRLATNGNERVNVNNSRFRVRQKLEVYGSGIELQKQSNGGGVGLLVTDNNGGEGTWSQEGQILFYHSDGAVTAGSNAAWLYTSSEPVTHHVFGTAQGGTVAGGNVIPQVDNTGSLGLTTHRWNALYANNGTFSGNVTGDNAYFNRYYDRGDNNFYADPASTSVFNILNLTNNAAPINDYSALNINNGNGTGDIDAPESWISWNFTDSNANFTPQVRIGGRAGYNSGSADNLDKEGSGNFIVQTSIGTGGAGAGSLRDTFWVNYLGDTQSLTSSRAPIFYDSNNTAWFADPASESRLNTIKLDGNAVVLREPTGTYGSLAVDGGGRNGWEGFSIGGRSVFMHDNVNRTGIYNDVDNHWFLYADRGSSLRLLYNNVEQARTENGYFLANNQIRSPIFYDSNNTGYYVNPASTSRLNLVQALRYYFNHNTTYYMDQASGNYGSVKTGGATGGWSGYAIEDWWVFMADGVSNAGIYNDTDNEWAILARRNAEVELYYNGIEEATTASGYFLARNQMRAPIFIDSQNTSYFLNPAAGNTSQALKINGRIYRDGFDTGSNGDNNKLLEAQDYSHWIWNTATDWGIFWAGNNNAAYSHFGSSNPNEFVFVGNGNVRASIDLDNGNAYFQGEVSASNYNLNGGNENISLNPTYTRGHLDETLFDGTKYFEKRVIKVMQGNENNTTGSTSEFVKSSDAPGGSSYVLRTSAYRTFYSDYVEVEPGEEVFGEIHARRISGSGGLLYYGIERFDKDKRPIAGNTGTTYFVVSANNVTSTSWQTFRNHTTIPTSHTPYNGSDGGGVRYVRLRILYNYSSGGALREFTAPVLKRVNAFSNIRTDYDIWGSVFRDVNNSAYYLDMDSVSYLNDIRPNIMYDRNDTNYYVNPATGSRLKGSNGSLVIQGSWPQLRIAQDDGTADASINYDAGSGYRKWNVGPGAGTSEGDEFGFAVYSSTRGTHYGTNLRINALTGRVQVGDRDNPAYNLDVVGTGYARGDFRAPVFYDANDTGYFTNPNSSSRFHNVEIRNYGLRLMRNYTHNGIWFNGGTDQNHVLWNTYYGGPAGRGGAGSGRDGIRWNVYGGIELRGGSNGAYPLIIANNSSGNSNNHTVELYAHNVKQFETESGYALAPNQMRSPIYYDTNTAYFGNFNGESSLNTLRTAGRVVIGGNFGNNAYNSVASTRLHFGGGNSDANGNYYIGTNLENYNGNYTKLDLRWHTGIRMGAQAVYGGTRIYNNEDLSTLLFSVGRGDTHVRVESGNNLYVTSGDARATIFYDINDTNYYANPNGTSRFYEQRNVYRLHIGDESNLYNAVLQETRRPDLTIKGQYPQLNIMSSEISNGTHGPTLRFVAYDSANASSGNFKHWVMGIAGTNATRFSIGYSPNQTNPHYGIGRGWSSGNNVAIMWIENNRNVYMENNLYANAFYSRTNTGYYLDPDGTSRFNTVLANRIYPCYDNNTGVYIDYPTGSYGSIQVNGSGRSGWEGYSINGRYVFMSADNSQVGIYNDIDNEWMLYAERNSHLYLYHNGQWEARTDSGYFRMERSGRAPIFYDLNNTGYYANPAGQSHFNTLTLAGNRLGFINTSFDAEIRVSDSNPDGTGATFVFYGDTVAYNAEVATEVFRGTRHMRAPRYYDLNNASYYGDFASTSYMNDLRANIFYERENTAYYFGGSQGDASMRTLTVDTIHMRDRGDFITFYGNDSTYHSISSRDNGGGVTDDLRFNSYHDIFFNLDSNNNNSSGSTGFYVGQHGAATGGISGWYFQAMCDGNSYASSSFRAPIFYDRNDTGYYVNPNSSSQLRQVYANDWFRPQGNTGLYFQSYGHGIWAPEAEGNPYGNVATYGSGRNGWRGYGLGSRWTLMTTNGNNWGMHDNNRSWNYYYNGSYHRLYYGYVYNDSSFRAPIFYDLNNTAYYFNGASTNSTRFRGVQSETMAYMALPGHTRNSAEYYRARPRITGDTNYWTGAMGWGRIDMNVVSTWGSGFIDSWSNPPNQPSGTSHWVGVQAFHYRNSNTSGYGWQMVGGPITNLRFRSSWSGWRSWRTIPVLDENSTNGGAMYAGIYYDSNNTGYYANPNSTSNFYRLQLVNELHVSTGNGTGVGIRLADDGDIVDNNNGYCTMRFSNGVIVTSGNRGGSSRHYLYSSGRYDNTSQTRSPIYYDRNSSGYYGDFASTSRLNQLNVNRINSPYAGGNSGITRSSSPYSYGFQESGGWSYPYPDLVLQYHTGMSFAGNPSYGGMRFFNDYNSGTVRFQINGSSSYTYANTWLRVAGANQGIYSTHNGAHFEPNALTNYGSWNFRGSRSGWRGISFHDAGYDPHVMWDGSGNGGFYHEDLGRWLLYHNRGNNCMGVASSSTRSGYRMQVNGSLWCTGNIVAYSDERRKENIETIENGLEKVLQLRGVTYTRKLADWEEERDNSFQGKQMGLIAQEVMEIVPEVVTHDVEDDEFGIDYPKMVGLLVEAHKDQQKIINSQQEKIDKLEEMVYNIMNKMENK